jgi:hypothetical protein
LELIFDKSLECEKEIASYNPSLEARMLEERSQGHRVKERPEYVDHL